MPPSRADFFFSTYARTIISDWSPVAAWIRIHSLSSLKEQHGSSSQKTPNLLTEEQLHEIINGPYQHFIKHTFSAYAKIIHARQQHNIHNEDVFKDFARTYESKITKSQQQKIENADLKSLLSKLTSVFQQHAEQWDTVMKQWQDAILKQLQSHQLTEMEITEFKAFEPLTELLNRFSDLNIELPKLKKIPMNFADFLIIKSHLLIYSALSRQHSPNTTTDIQNVLKTLKPLIDQIRTQEKELHSQQENTNTELMEPLSFIVFNQKKS